MSLIIIVQINNGRTEGATFVVLRVGDGVCGKSAWWVSRNEDAWMHVYVWTSSKWRGRLDRYRRRLWCMCEATRVYYDLNLLFVRNCDSWGVRSNMVWTEGIKTADDFRKFKKSKWMNTVIYQLILRVFLTGRHEHVHRSCGDVSIGWSELPPCIWRRTRNGWSVQICNWLFWFKKLARPFLWTVLLFRFVSFCVVTEWIRTGYFFKYFTTSDRPIESSIVLTVTSIARTTDQRTNANLCRPSSVADPSSHCLYIHCIFFKSIFCTTDPYHTPTQSNPFLLAAYFSLLTPSQRKKCQLVPALNEGHLTSPSPIYNGDQMADLFPFFSPSSYSLSFPPSSSPRHPQTAATTSRRTTMGSNSSGKAPTTASLPAATAQWDPNPPSLTCIRKWSPSL